MPLFSAFQALRSSSVHQSKTLKAQSFKFVITGVVSAVVDISLTWVLQIGWGVLSPTAARTIGFIFGTLTAYFLNRAWTFRAQRSSRRFVAVVVLYSITYLVNVGGYRLLLELFVGIWDWNQSVALVIGFVIAQGTATVINFVIQRMVIFKNAEPI